MIEGNQSAAAADQRRIRELIDGYQQTCVIVAAVQLGIFERLDQRPVSEDELARELGVKPQSVLRLLRVLLAMGLVMRRGSEWASTSAGQLLRRDRQLGARALLAGEEYLPAWAHLRYSVETGKPAFDHVAGMSIWEHRRQHVELNEGFNRWTATGQEGAARALCDAYDFSGCQCIVDVGGGLGILLAHVLQQHPRASGILFDQPHVVEGARAVIEDAGVGDRCRVVGGSFFESVPCGGDLLILMHVLHDWHDENCATILRNCRAAVGAGGTLLVVEGIVSEENFVSARPLLMLDMHMMAVLGGRERTMREFEALLTSAGFRDARHLQTSREALDIIEARA